MPVFPAVGTWKKTGKLPSPRNGESHIAVDFSHDTQGAYLSRAWGRLKDSQATMPLIPDLKGLFEQSLDRKGVRTASVAKGIKREEGLWFSDGARVLFLQEVPGSISHSRKTFALLP